MTILVVTATGGLYLVVPAARRFIKSDQPVWWVRDILIAVLVAMLFLLGQSYLVDTSGARELGQDQAEDQDQDQDQRTSDLQFVRDRSSEWYQARPFRQFDLRGMNLAGLELRGANFAQANLSGVNLTGTVLRPQTGTPEAPGRPAVPSVQVLLQGVNLCHAVLTGADLRGSYLSNANLTGADLSFTRLQGAALNGTDLSKATLPSDISYLADIYYDDNTIWPEGFQPPPSAVSGNQLDFLRDPINNELYGDIQRPVCN